MRTRTIRREREQKQDCQNKTETKLIQSGFKTTLVSRT